MIGKRRRPTSAANGPAAPSGSGNTDIWIGRHQALLARLGALVVLAVAASVMLRGGFYGQLVVQMLVFAIAAMGLDLLAGYAGLVSLGQAGFVGLGAYGVAVSEQHGLGPWTSVGMALLVVLAVGLIAGFLAVRVSGIGFVIITLALGQIMWGLAFRYVALSGGDNGLAIANAPVLGPFDLNNSRTLAIAVLVVFVLSALVLRAFVASPFGLSLRGIKSNEPRLKTLGYATGLHRYIGYVISVFFGGVAGVLFAFTNGLISPTAMDFSHNGIITLMAVLGGLGTLWGPVLGSVVITLFQQDLSIYVARWATLMGTLFVVVVIFAPEGLWGVARKYTRRLTHQSRRTPSIGIGGGALDIPGAGENEVGLDGTAGTAVVEEGVIRP